MPAPLRRCLGCGRKTPRTRCKACERKQDAQYDRHHRDLRVEVLMRDAGLCQCAGCPVCLGRHALDASCKRAASTADHIVPLARGGTTTLDNLRAMCRPCNSSKRDR